MRPQPPRTTIAVPGSLAAPQAAGARQTARYLPRTAELSVTNRECSNRNRRMAVRADWIALANPRPMVRLLADAHRSMVVALRKPRRRAWPSAANRECLRLGSRRTLRAHREFRPNPSCFDANWLLAPPASRESHPSSLTREGFESTRRSPAPGTPLGHWGSSRARCPAADTSWVSGIDRPL